MTEYTEVFDIVLYFNRKVFVKPIEPVFTEIQKANPALNIDDILDIYSDLNNKYKEDVYKYDRLENKDIIVTGCALIPEDKNFISNCQKIEADEFFVKWEKKSYDIIKETIKKLLSTQL